MKKNIIFTILGGLAAFACTVLAWTALSQNTQPAGTGDSILRIPACAFNGWRDGYDYNRGHFLGVNSDWGTFYAPVNLPYGSTVKKIKMVCSDNNGSVDADLRLYRNKHIEGGEYTAEWIGYVASSDTTGYETFSDFVITGYRYVNNEKYDYVLKLYLGGVKISIHHVELVYMPPSP